MKPMGNPDTPVEQPHQPDEAQNAVKPLRVATKKELVNSVITLHNLRVQVRKGVDLFADGVAGLRKGKRGKAS